MLTEEQIQIMEKELNIKRDTRPDGKCVFGIYEEGRGCGRPAVNWLLNTASGDLVEEYHKYSISVNTMLMHSD